MKCLAGGGLGLLLALAAMIYTTDMQATPGENRRPRQVEAVIRGQVLAVAAGGATTPGLVLLVASEEPSGHSRRLVFLEFEDQEALRPLAADLPLSTSSVVLFDGELLIGEPGRIATLGRLSELRGETIEPRLMLAAPDLNLGRLRRSGFLDAPGDRLWLPELGRLRCFERRADSTLVEVSELNLPVSAAREETGLRLWTPRPTLLVPDEKPLLVLGPEAHGDRRLLSYLIDPTAAVSSGRVVEAWSRLPTPETVDASWHVLLGGRPALIVTTYNAQKIGIFERQKLRVFRLEADRTRAGRGPLLDILTKSRRWQETDPHVLDADGDGRDDLVVIHQEGFDGAELVVDLYPGRDDGGLSPTSRSTTVKAPDSSWRYGDVNGDDLPDLVALSRGRLLIFAGLDASAKRAVGKKPKWEIEVGRVAKAEDEAASWSRPRLIDVDGEGGYEILLRAREADGEETLRVVSLF